MYIFIKSVQDQNVKKFEKMTLFYYIYSKTVCSTF